MSDPIRVLKTYGRDVGAIPFSRVPTAFPKAAFLCVNTYTSYRLNLGTGPINDAVSLAKVVKAYGFEIYFMHNPHARNFLKYLDLFFKATSGHLLVYYVGHGTSFSESGTHQEEAFIFDDGRIPEDELVDHLIELKNPTCEITLITDACHEGTIWDIQEGSVRGKQLPPNVISLSACNDPTIPKKSENERLEQGIFTYNLTKILKGVSEITPTELAPAMNTILRNHAQKFVVGTTSPELLTQSLFY
jgi:hypothetical protein